MTNRTNKQATDVKSASDNDADKSGENLNEALIAGESAITDIENMMSELRVAREYLQAEAERVMHANARYTHLAKTASASARRISESMGKWRDDSSLSAPPSLAALQAPETQPEMSDE
jgi:hypothetical protein